MDAGGAGRHWSDIGGLIGHPGRWRATVGAGALGVIALVGLGIALRPSSPFPFLVPWVVLTAITLVVIVLTTPDDRRDDALDPVPFAIATYFGPFAVVGALLLAGGWTEPFYTQLIDDPPVDLPLAQLYLTLGIVALAIGSRLGVARGSGRWVARRLPSIGLHPSAIAPGLVVVHLAGLAATYWAFRDGFVGYQTVAAGRAGALPAYLTTVLIPARIAVAMVWVRHRAPRPTPVRLAVAVSVATVPAEMALGASRATLLVAALSVGFGAIAAGWRPRLGRAVTGLALGAVALSFSISFATTFRELKNPAGSEVSVAVDEQLRLAVDAVGRTVARGPLILPDALDTAADRLEATGQVAVVVSQYAERRDAERAAGVDSSVVDAMLAGAVPRLIWGDKPDPPDPRAISTIYFGFDGNSFATTPMTDLLRNYGPLGVPVGMAVLGVGLGVLGTFRRARADSVATNMVVGAILIRAVSYEGFFGAIVADATRVGFVATVAALFLRVVSVGHDGSDTETGGEIPARTGRAALVSVDLSQRGGHQGVATYLQDCLEREGWEVSLVSLATSSRDRNSVLARSPRTWRGPQVSIESFDGRSYRHVGCWFAELPILRARPRRALDGVLAGHDVVVLGVGSCFWTLAVPPATRDRTVVEFVTRYDDETVSALRAAAGWRRAFWHIQRRVVSLQERRALETMAAAIVPSDELATWARSMGARDVTVVPHAIADRLRPDPDRPIRPIVVSVARWTDPRKNLPLLLDAFARAVERDPAIGTLVLAGTPPPSETLAAIGAHGRLGDVVEVAGEVGADRLVELFQSARLVVSASDQEGFGLPLVEAMACGCPVVATRSGGSELTVVNGENGLLVPSRDAAALADAIVELATDEDLRARLSAGAGSSAAAYRVAAVAPSIGGVVGRVATGDASSASRETKVDA